MAISVASGAARVGEKPLASRPETAAGSRRASFFGLRKEVKPGELIYFTSQIALMLEVGTSLTDALQAMARQSRNPAFQAVLNAMVQEVEEGRQLSDAMALYPHIFDGVFTSMIRAGEAGGFLKETLERLAVMQEKRRALLNQLRTALTYPAILCLLAGLVVVFILTVVLPKFTAFFEGKESILPLTTRFLMGMSASLQGYWWAYVLGAFGFVVGFKLFRQSPPGQILRDQFMFRAPLVAKLANKAYTCQLLRTMGHLMESRVPLLDALKVTRDTMQNRYYKRLVDQMTERVQQGSRLSAAFADAPYIMESVRQMVGTGEEAGNLYPVMLRLAEFYDTEVEQELKTVGSLIEPMALIVLGSVVGLILSSVILPLFKLAHAL